MEKQSTNSIDYSIVLAVFSLIGLGLVVVYSATAIYAGERMGDNLFFFKRQLLFSIAGLSLMYGIARMPSSWITKSAFPLWLFSLVLLVLTHIPGVGVKVGGAKRWIQLSQSFRFEPSELFKVALCLILAQFFIPKKLTFLHWLLRIGVMLLPFLVILKQPDFGTFSIGLMVILGMLLAGGLTWKYWVLGGVMIIPPLITMVAMVPYRRARILAFLDPWSDPSEKGFQMIQSMLGFYNGGLSGVGLGQSQSKLYFLPEAHTDFILSILGEEMGLIGVALVMLLFGYLIYRGIQISSRSQSEYGERLALGLTLTLAISVFINIGVALGMLPTKGLALPFLSYGGSSLIMSCIAIGLLLNVARENGARVKSGFSGK